MAEPENSLLETCKLAFRKHVLDDPDIGWDELSERLRDTLAEEMGVAEFAEWVENMGPGKPVSES